MINVLRIGHRISRDKRITTHVALVARAFGADRVYIDNKDSKIEDNVLSVCRRFGGDFKIETGVNIKKIINQWNGLIVHLTMYGEELEKSIDQIDDKEDLLIIVGSEKVPSYIYDLADFNISVGNQPHSEIAALAIFLDRYNKGKWIDKSFNGKIKILPSDKGKKVISNDI
jgi:tRNA (cytidine56-2'-O)-methyltransferase